MRISIFLQLLFLYLFPVKIANFAGWIGKNNYEIVPLSWVKSSSSYTVNDSSIKHNYIKNVILK